MLSPAPGCWCTFSRLNTADSKHGHEHISALAPCACSAAPPGRPVHAQQHHRGDLCMDSSTTGAARRWIHPHQTTPKARSHRRFHTGVSKPRGGPAPWRLKRWACLPKRRLYQQRIEGGLTLPTRHPPSKVTQTLPHLRTQVEALEQLDAAADALATAAEDSRPPPTRNAAVHADDGSLRTLAIMQKQVAELAAQKGNLLNQVWGSIMRGARSVGRGGGNLLK
eukprot:364892-Chlamydomonas_euryale.AAC.1